MKNKLSLGIKFTRFILCQLTILLCLTGCTSGFGTPFQKSIESIELNVEQKNWLTKNINDFSFRSSPIVLSGEDVADKNLLYSPTSLYLALSMLYECADMDSTTKKEIEETLQPITKGIQADMCNALYQNLVHQNEMGNLNLENTILKKKGLDFPRELKTVVMDKYHGNITDITESDVQNYNLRDDTLFVIINAIIFEGKWVDPFEENEISTEAFILKNKEMLDWNFMNRTYKEHIFIKSKSFVASALTFENGYAIHFILPNEGISPIELINKPDALKLAIDYSETNSDRVNVGDVHFKIPKVKFESQMDLNDTMRKLGIASAYEGGFSRLDQPNSNHTILTDVHQTASFELNEEGAKAKAVTQMEMATSDSLPVEETPELYLYLTRPFLLEITSPEDYVLFTGVVNNPADTSGD